MSNLSENPTEWGYKIWFLIVGLASLGGVSNWVKKRNSGQKISIMELIGEVTTSASTGIGVFMLMLSLDYPIYACAGACGVSGHFATRILFALQNIIDAFEEKKIKELIDDTND